MKYCSRFLFLSALALSAVQLRAQVQVPKQVKPNITYSEERNRYILGGLVVEGGGSYDEEYLKSVARLTVGKSYDVPGDDISEALRRSWDTRMFSNVRSEADSSVVWVYISYQRNKLAALHANVRIQARRNVGYCLEELP